MWPLKQNIILLYGVFVVFFGVKLINKALPVSTNTKTSDIILQILEGKQHNIKMFGYSLAGNMDLDQNSYPDLAIGSLSDTVFIYRCWQLTFHVKVVTWRFVRCYSNIPLVCRSKTVISIKKDIKVTPKEIDLMKKTCGNSIWWDTDKTRTSKASLWTMSFEKIIMCVSSQLDCGSLFLI